MIPLHKIMKPSNKDKLLPSTNRQSGFILIAAMAMLVTLLGIVLLCLYPLTHEARQAPRHREAQRRFKTAERGLFGRMADQSGGAFSACGGYFSDTGFKMVVAELVPQYSGGDLPRLRRAMEYWYFRRFSDDAVGVGRNEGCDDIYRYDREKGFWVGYRGKRYVVRPVGEEHRRRTYHPNTLNNTNDGNWEFVIDPDLPIFTDGYRGYLELTGEETCKAFFLSGAYNLDFVEYPGSEDMRHYEHRRYFNPVEKLVLRVRDRRDVQTFLSAVLAYAKQPDVEPLDDIVDRLPLLSPEVIMESPYRTDYLSGDITEFVFRWDHDHQILGDDDSPPNACVGHTFEIGLKKLVLLENDVPVFACGITVPPVREFQCRETQSIPNGSTGCRQLYYDQYVVEIDYDG